jgi:hypothetical protein
MDSVSRELNGGSAILDGIETRSAGQRAERLVKASSREDFVHAIRVNRSDRVIGWFPSFIAGCTQPYHSLLELDWLRLLDVTPGVAQLKAQSRTVQVWFGGAKHDYTADTEVVLENGRRLMIEVKPHEHAVRPEFQLIWEAIRARFAEEATDFKVVTDRYLKTRRHGALHLQMFNTWSPDPQVSRRLSEILADGTCEPLGLLVSEFPNPKEAERTVMSLARRRRLLIDLSKPINNDLEISLMSPDWL